MNNDPKSLISVDYFDYIKDDILILCNIYVKKRTQWSHCSDGATTIYSGIASIRNRTDFGSVVIDLSKLTWRIKFNFNSIQIEE